MKKQTTACLMAAVLGIGSLTGCTSGTKNEETKRVETSESVQTADDQNTEITIMGGAHLVSVAEVVLKDFIAEHQGLTINFEKYSFAEYPTKMKLQLSNNEATPDIMIIHDMNIAPFAKAGYLADLSDMVQEGDILKVTTPAEKDGKLYGLPNQVTNQYVYMYRGDVYEQEGLSAPKTFDEYFQQGLQLKEKGYYVGAFDPSDPLCRYVFKNFIYMLGGCVLDEEGNVALEKGEEALDLIKKCNDAGIWHKSSSGEGEAFWSAFNDGQIAAFPHLASHAAYFQSSADPEGKGGYGKLAIAPAMKFAEDGRNTYLGQTEYYAINKNSEHMELAKEIVRYLALSEDAALKFANVNEDGVMAQFATGYVPGIKAIAQADLPGWEAFGGEKVISELSSMLLEQNPDVPYVDERSSEIDTIIAEVLGEMFLNGKYKDSAEAIADMRKKIEAI